jgi:hypothetical protein
MNVTTHEPPAVTRRPRLRVVQEAPPRPLQDCTRCRNLPRCWDQRLKPQAIAINLLVCRMKLRIDTDRATRTLLAMVEPKIRSLAYATKRALRNATVEELVLEMKSVAVESLLQRFVLGDIYHPLHWLFGEPDGAVVRWAQRKVRDARKESRRTFHFEAAADLDESLIRANYLSSNKRVTSGPADHARESSEYDLRAAERERASRVLATLDDGISLTAREYRVLSFCLSNAHEGARWATNGLHLELAARLGVSRSYVTRVYGEAIRRLIDASGETSAYLRARGIAQPRTASSSRRRRIVLGKPDQLGAAEIAEMVGARREKPVPIQDLAWLYGVSEYFARCILERFGHLTEGEILETLNR